MKRTKAFRELGILGCAEVLSSAGVTSPTEQMVIICQFVITGLQRWSPSLPDIREWAVSRLLDTAAGWRAGQVSEPWSYLLVHSIQAIAWDPYRQFGHLLNVQCGTTAFGRAAGRLYRRGLKLGSLSIADMRDDFAEYHLPRALRTFDPAKGVGHEAEWLSTVFYRFALNCINSDELNQAHLTLLTSFDNLEESPEDAFLRIEEEKTAENLPLLVTALPNSQRVALQLYFGISGPEATLERVAKALGVSEYKARGVVVSALAHLAVKSGLPGVLNDTESAYARALFVDGLSAPAAAHLTDVRRGDIGKAIATKFRRALRTRTARGDVYHDIAGKAWNMVRRPTGETYLDPEELRSEIIRALTNLDRRPQVRPDEQGRLHVDFGHFTVDIRAVRAALDDPTIAHLQKKGVPVDWILAGPPSTERADIDRDADLIDAQIDDMRQRQGVVAATLYDLCLERSKSTWFPMELRDHTIERIYVVLTAIAQSLEELTPEESWETEYTEFLIYRSGDGTIFGRWAQAAENRSLELEGLVRQQAAIAGGMDALSASLLASEVARGLIGGEIKLPGFDAIEAENDGATLLWSLQRLVPT